jgi:uncharacterized membrane protein YdfJ with MMPL/SSD domain
MRLCALAAAAVLAIAAPAFAQTDQQAGQPAPEQGQHQGVSPEVRDAMQAMHKACEADMKSLCADAQSSGDRRAVGQCLRQNADKVSADCKAAMEKMRSLRRPEPQPQ